MAAPWVKNSDVRRWRAAVAAGETETEIARREGCAATTITQYVGDLTAIRRARRLDAWFAAINRTMAEVRA